MPNINGAVHGIHHMDSMASKDKWINNIHPLGKMIMTITYILVVISFDKYNVTGLASMSVYLFLLFIIADIPFWLSLKHLKPILFLVCLLGIFNPIFDTQEYMKLGNIIITSGMISMITLIFKGIFSVMASYLFISTTSIEKICYALRKLHIPKGIVTMILLIYRYIIVLLKEVERMSIAYKLRAPKQHGIAIKAWGSFVGQLLLRSIDRAENVYESMLLRGYDGEFIYKNESKSVVESIVFTIIMITMIIIFRIIPIFELVGEIFI